MDSNQSTLDEKRRDQITLDDKMKEPMAREEMHPPEAISIPGMTKANPLMTSMSTGSMSISNPRAGLPPGTSLANIFRFHMGIENDSSLVPPHLAKRRAIDPIATGTNQGRRAVNLGIYNRAIREERYCSTQYKVWSLVINGSLGLQIVFAAILTALGAGKGPADAVAIFGALNTIIAGFLTYLKGTGLPNRMKYFHNQWLKLRAYIEQRERDFANDDHSGINRYGYNELIDEIDIVEKMYHNIRKDIERHTPDSYGGGKGGSDSASDAHAPGEGAPPASFAARGLNALKAQITGTATQATQAGNHVESRVKGAVEDIEKRLSSALTSHLSKLEEHKQVVTGSAQNAANQAQQQVRDLGAGARASVVDTLDGAESEIQDVSDIAVERMRVTQARAIDAQKQAEQRVSELERRLATITEDMAEKVLQMSRERQGQAAAPAAAHAGPA